MTSPEANLWFFGAAMSIYGLAVYQPSGLGTCKNELLGRYGDFLDAALPHEFLDDFPGSGLE